MTQILNYLLKIFYWLLLTFGAPLKGPPNKRDFINITLVHLAYTPTKANPITFRMNVVEAFIYKSIWGLP
jgi:hypothetical protein